MSRTADELMAAREKNVPRGALNMHPIFVKEAKGATLTSVDGKEYIDFAGGIGTINVGHCPEAVVDAITDQARKLIHTCFHVAMYEPYIELAEKLNALTPGKFAKKTMFSNSGAEAVENGVKIARYHTGRPGVVCFEHAFHGRTLLTMSLTSKVKPYKFGFGPFAPEIYRMPSAYCYRCAFGLTYPSCELACARHLEDFFVTNAAAENIATLIIEPVFGEGGFIVPPKEYFAHVYKTCKNNGIVFIMDEIQSGICRTGKLYASEHFGIEPDIILSAKSLSAGIPLSAVTGRSEIMDAPHVAGLGGTFGGNPVACRAALAVLELVEQERLSQKAQVIGDRIRQALGKWKEEYKIVGDVRGLGAMMAVELVKDRKTKEPAADETKNVVAACREAGLLTLSCGSYGNVIRTLAPLVITEKQLDKGLSIMEKAVQKANANL